MMLRKFLHIFLAVFMIAVSSTVDINMHYCSEKLVSVTIATSSCDSCCQNESNKCCETETKYFQLEDLFHSTDKKDNFISATIIPLNHTLDDIAHISNIENRYPELYYLPPLKTSIRLSLKQSYLI